MAPFNNGQPLRIVRLPSGDLGAVDEAERRVWVGETLASTYVRDLGALPRVDVPPVGYGTWKRKSVGGVSSTMRLEGLLRAAPRSRDPVVVFATHGPTADAAERALVGLDATVGVSEHDAEFGHVAEVIVHHPANLDFVAARLAAAGMTPVLEDANVNARRCLGIERLDRIGAHVLGDDGATHGPRRGMENWRFEWQPAHWARVPITWDHMVENVGDAPLETIPQPLRQHVARARLDRLPRGTCWAETFVWQTVRERRDDGSASEGEEGTDGGGSGGGGSGNRSEDDGTARAPAALVDALVAGRRSFEAAELTTLCGTWADVPDVVVVPDGRRFRPCAPRALTRHVPRRRLVSAALTPAQSRQLIEAFHAIEVARTDDPDVRRAAQLVLFHYMKERGYTARWMGKYDQEGKYVGNGDRFRRFARLAQYAPHRLPSSVLNKLCDRTGTLRTRGSKGSRSKHKPRGDRYVPAVEIVRTQHDEDRMRGGEV